MPEYVRDKNIQRVQQWAGISFDDAERMFHTRPARFLRLLGWANVEADAEPIQYAYADEKAKNKAAHEKAAHGRM